MDCRQPSTSSQEPLAQLVFEATGNLHLGRVRVPAILSAGYLCTVELVPCNSSWKRAHIHRVSIAALSSSQLSPETARHYISLRWRPPPALLFPSSLSPLVRRTQMSFLALDLVCAPYSTEPATVNGPTWRSSTLHPLLHCHRPCWRPQAKGRSKRTGRKGLKISQAVSHYRRPPLIIIQRSRPDLVYSLFHQTSESP